MASRMSLADQIAEIINPAPINEALEDDVDTAARVVDKFDDDELEPENIGESRLRIQNATLLDGDKRYSGRRISAKNLRDEESEEELKESEGESDENEEESDENDDEFDENAEITQQELEGGAEYDDDDSEGSENSEESDEDGEDNNNIDDKEENEVAETFSKLDFTSEIEKGAGTKAQLLLWDSLLECRIKLQKVLQLSNQLPQHDGWSQFLCDVETKKTHKEGVKELENLLDKLVTLQTSLLSKYPETKKQVLQQETEMDEEITSSDDDNEDEEIDSKQESLRKATKRKLPFKEYPEFLAKRHADFQYFRDNTIQKWNDRTRLTTGKMKSFNSFDQTALKQIEQIMSDKNRLLTRCRTKRSVYKILGKDDCDDETSGVDPEIFDDDDFYQQLLRELIEKQGQQIDDPIALGHHWAKIQKLRGKMKKNVDTKASKGRRIRYKVHTKLVNFMAPYDYDQVTGLESRNDLFNSLFGKTRQEKLIVSNHFLFGPINKK